MAKTLSRSLHRVSHSNPLTHIVNGRSFSSAGFPFLSLASTPAPVTAPRTTSAAAQLPSARFAQPRKATASSVDAVPLPTFPCEKSANTATFTAIARADRERAFTVSDVAIPERQYDRLQRELERVRPFYAVKCSPDMTLIRTLAAKGAGFDCASSEEISQCLSIGVPPEDIIFANPIKSIKDLKYARSVGVKKMTFDNEPELYKIREHCPNAELVIRLLADDSGSKMKFGVKFGAPNVHVEGLLRTAKLGMPKFTFLDLGGGFPGNPNVGERGADGTPAFEEFAAVIRQANDQYFPVGCGVDIIAEPGRYFATAWSTSYVLVQGKREEPKRADDTSNKRKFLYYINDGVYGSFNSIMFDHAHPEPIPAYRFMDNKVSLQRTPTQRKSPSSPYVSTEVPQMSAAASFATSFFGFDSAPVQQSARAIHTTNGRDRDCVGTFFGPTCDSMDVVATDFPCEELFVGDWLAFAHNGAYTSAAATTFNGMPKPTVHYVRSRQPSPSIAQ